MYYQLLPRRDPEDTASSEEDIHAKLSPPSSKSQLSSWALVACIVLTIANFATVYIFPPTALPRSIAFLLDSPRLTRREISKLRHPTQFIGLDRIHPHLSKDVKPFINKPFLSARIDKSNPDKSFFDADQQGYTAPIGTIFPAYHRITLTPTVSTILQFRAIDYGMEACELTVSLPARHAARHEATSVEGRDFAISDLPITLRLSQLDMPLALDAETVSYQTRPRTLHKIAEFSVGNLPATFSHNFTCTMEEVFTFELGCQSPECHVEWWQDKGNLGVALVQHSSL